MTPETGDILASRWQALTASLGVSADLSQRAFDQIRHEYDSSGRHYHTLDHVGAMLKTMDSLLPLAKHPAAVQLAAWYHDCIYVSRRNGNEEASANVAQEALILMGIDHLAEPVFQLILATKHHRADDIDAAILLDADLAILGAEPVEYDRYAVAIRREYDWVPDDQFRAGRAKVLDSFLNRPTIYATESMRTRFEERARSNLRRELADLSGGARIEGSAQQSQA